MINWYFINPNKPKFITFRFNSVVILYPLTESNKPTSESNWTEFLFGSFYEKPNKSNKPIAHTYLSMFTFNDPHVVPTTAHVIHHTNVTKQTT